MDPARPGADAGLSSTYHPLSRALADRYRIERKLGEGGMASVFLAHDVKHDRRVALKVLKPELAAVLGAERFVVEIRTTAALQHPHILPLFDSGTADGFLYYVMPFIDGETLRSKLDRETQLGIDESVKIATAVADALDYAHRHGVIHRDIKPENILLHDGRPMVADFGIALAVSAAAGGRMTETGLSLGTPHYMSPEQATAEKEITGRSDIYSLATVLFEMLAGQPPHLGGSAQQIIMKIIAEQPSAVTQHRKSVPPNVAAAVAKALEKLPADRFESANAFAAALANPAFRLDAQSAAAGRAPIIGLVNRRTFAAVSAVAVVAITAAIVGWSRAQPTQSPAPMRYQVSMFASSFTGDDWRNVAISTDGRDIAFSQPRGGTQMIWLKTPHRSDAEPLSGTEGGRAPTFSSDGEWIAFAAGGQLRKIRRDGRDATTITEGLATGNSSIAWLDDGTLLFAGARSNLSAVNGAGTVRVVIPRDSLPNNVVDIAGVPGSRTALFVTCSSNCTEGELWAVDLRSGLHRRLHDHAMRVWYMSGGLAVFVETEVGRVLAAGFSEGKLSLRTPPTLVAEDVRRFGGENSAMALSESGTLLFSPRDESSVAQAVWFTREGKATSVDSAWSFDAGNGATVSPDGRRLAIILQDGASADIWIKELTPGAGLSRLTFDGNARGPEWIDNETLLYTTDYSGAGPWYVKRRRVEGTDTSRIILRTTRGIASLAYLRDTMQMIVRFGPPPTRDIYLARRIPRAVADTFVPLLASPAFEEVAISLSPDERWLAYASNETGRFEVYVVPFPDVKARKWQISTAGGRSPRWSRDGRELFFRDLADGLLTVPVANGGSPTFGERRLLFRIGGSRVTGQSGDPMQVQFDVSPDGRRFLFLRRASSEIALTPATAILVQNWLTSVRERVKGSR